MNKMNLKVFTILFVGILFLASNRVMGQKDDNAQGCHKGSGKMCNLPDLTDAQKKKIDELHLSHQKSMLQYKNQLAEKTTHLQTLRTAEKPDMNSINKTVDEIGVIQTQMMKERENHLQEVRAQLTDSQKTQFDLQQGKCHQNGCCSAGVGMKCGKGHGGMDMKCRKNMGEVH